MTGYTMPSGRYERGGDHIIVPAGTRGMDLARMAVLVAVLTSAPWAWMLNQERARTEALLTEKVAQQMRVTHVVVKFSNGVTDKLSVGAK